MANQKLEQASGKAQAEATFEVLDLWELIDNVTSLVLDTTASNSGWRCGAAKLLEGLMGKRLFYHACRHHIYELVIKSVYQQIFGSATTGPENVLFKEFKSAWSSIDTTQDIQTLELDPSYKWLEQRAKEVTEELTQLLSREQERERINRIVLIRDDYTECADNNLVLLNAVPNTMLRYENLELFIQLDG